MSVRNQALGTFIACWIRMSTGIIFAWPSFMVHRFKSNDTPLHRPMTETEAAVFGSLFCLGGLLCTPLLSLLLDVIGRKKSLMLTALVHAFAWLALVFSRRVEVLLASVFIAGAGGGAASLTMVPVYINEICQPSIRGTLTTSMILAYWIGTLSSYLLGGFMEYYKMCRVSLGVAALGVTMMIGMEDTPVFLMRKGKYNEAVRAMAFYRNATVESGIVLQEIEAIRKTLGTEERSKEEETLMGAEKPARSVSWWQFKNSKSSRKAASVTLILMVLSICQGQIAVTVYAGVLFREAMPSLSGVLCSVLLALVGIAASLLSTYLSDVAGRRPLMLYSSLGSGVCCLLLGSQIQQHWAPPIATAVFMCLFCFVYSMGAGAVPFVLAAEVFLPEVAGVMSMLVTEVAWTSSSVVLLSFGPLVSLLGLGGLFYVFAGVCFLTAVYTARSLPETKGLAVGDIQKLFIRDGK